MCIPHGAMGSRIKKELSRRTFFKYGFLSSAVIIMNGCELFSITTPHETIKVLQYDLFPQAKILNIELTTYLEIILHHSRISHEDKEFIKNGVKWLNEEALKLHKMSYINLLSTQRAEVLISISQKKWGAKFISTMTSYLFEAMLGDPIYGGNNEEAGWKWLEFSGGQPRPTEMYL